METYEKKYKDAQKWIESIYTELSHEHQMEAESFFLELKESEDERIRKELIKALSSIGKRNWGGIDVFESIAWLEKQGNKKPITIDIDKMCDSFAHTDIKGYGIPSMYEVDSYRKGINDALNLVLNIEKQGEQKSQRTISAEAKEALYDKPAWSEEDAFRASALTDVVKSGGSIRPELRNEFVDWLKSLKNRVQPIHEYSDTERQEMFIRSQRPHFWKPSDEQMKALKYVAYHLMPDNNYRKEMFSLYEDLKKLKGE